MPNWTENDLDVKGLLSEVNLFIKKAKGTNGDIDFNNFVPYPDDFIKKDVKAMNSKKAKDGFNSGGFEWCCNNWGTKWNACDIVMDLKTTNGKTSKLQVSFSTAWSPPLPIIKAMSKAFPTLTFVLNFYEAGCSFAGCSKFKNGSCFYEMNKDYNGCRGG